MCGIFFAASIHKPRLPTPEHKKLLQCRGPDSCHGVCVDAEEYPPVNLDHYLPIHDVNLTFVSTVLSLRGTRTVEQPYKTSGRSSVLCWNGEAWTVDGKSTDGNDTRLVYDKLLHTAHASSNASDVDHETPGRPEDIARAMSQIEGPYAFVFHDTIHGLIYFGRDFLGRRSLLINIATVDSAGDVLISSVADETVGPGWIEVEADGVYCLDLKLRMDRYGDYVVTKAPYNFIGDGAYGLAESVIPRLSLNKQPPKDAPLLSENSPSVQRLEQLLRRSLSLRILNIPQPPVIQPAPDKLPPAKLAILFSGGLDCTVLARLCHDVFPSMETIDLLNVAFENPRIHKSKDCSSMYELCPDRITGRASYAELQRVCPDRQWRFIAIDIPYTETMEHRQNVITLMHPHNTEMDLSISYALYFAARGIGSVSGGSSSAAATPYATSARVLLSGLGADELFGGYQRHATAYSRNGFTGLLDELELDVSRLGKRNLGRDDRVISHWGREARFPFLDEKLLAWALAAPVTEKCGFGETLDDGSNMIEDGSALLEPGKKVLRCLAWKLGMDGVAKEKKRAIQFGARTAKMETGKTKGTHVLS